MSIDVIGKALLDYQKESYTEDIVTFSSLQETDIIPLPYFFRTFEEMPPLEQKALQLCHGTILDIGAGAGSHSLHLQKRNFEVTALDASLGAMETCLLRGIRTVVHSTIESFEGKKYDTLLLLMNGIGLAGSLPQLGNFLTHLFTLLKPNGQLLVDSSDIIYMFKEEEEYNDGFAGNVHHTSEEYYGAVQFTMAYKGLKSKPFPWLFVDFDTLSKVAYEQNLKCELICKGQHYDYLAKIMMSQH